MDSRLVAELYHRFPYPKPRSLYKNPLRHSHLAECARLCCGLTPAAPKTMLVAGCGTIEALSWALSLPDTQVIGIDLSENSLKLQNHLARQLGTKNLELKQLDLLRAAQLGIRFDFISCFGVLHHLESPTAGLQSLLGVLQPDGMIRLMLYNHLHRGAYQEIQKRIREKESFGGSWETKYREAQKEVSALANNPGPLQQIAITLLESSKQDAAIFADTVLHPLETSFSVRHLMTWLEKSGFSLWFFEDLEAWEADSRLQGAPGFRDSDFVDQLERINNLRTPFLIFCGGLQTSPRPRSLPWLEEEKFFASFLQRAPASLFPILENFRVGEEISSPLEDIALHHPILSDCIPSLWKTLEHPHTGQYLTESISRDFSIPISHAKNTLISYLKHHLFSTNQLSLTPTPNRSLHF